jgi:hypothetical protein
MRIYVHHLTGALVQDVAYAREITTLSGKRRDRGGLEVVFTDGTQAVELPAGSTGTVGLKASGDYAAGFLASTIGWTKTGTGASTVYTFDFNLNTDEIDTAFASANDAASIPCMFELEWSEGGTHRESTPTITYTLANDVIRGDEGSPTSGDPPVSSLITPDVRAAIAISAAGETDIGSWVSNLTIIPITVADLAGGNAQIVLSGTAARGIVELIIALDGGTGSVQIFDSAVASGHDIDSFVFTAGASTISFRGYFDPAAAAWKRITAKQDVL